MNTWVKNDKEQRMIQCQCVSSGRQPIAHVPERSRLLQQHPVLLPFLLLCGSVVSGSASFFSSWLFPLLAFTGIPVGSLCIALAFVLGIAGLLTSITGILEYIDRHCFKATMYLKPKEQSYGN